MGNSVVESIAGQLGQYMDLNLLLLELHPPRNVTECWSISDLVTKTSGDKEERTASAAIYRHPVPVLK
ncbi:hypothetical protein J6590_047328 [Homalodisca vitripennis]|nr:hypothetical protein J6590_047328 [Homalodisca vitripennis]